MWVPGQDQDEGSSVVKQRVLALIAPGVVSWVPIEQRIVSELGEEGREQAPALHRRPMMAPAGAQPAAPVIHCDMVTSLVLIGICGPVRKVPQPV